MKKTVFLALLAFVFMVSCNCNQKSETCCSASSTATYQPTGDEVKVVWVVTVKPEHKAEMISLFEQITKDVRAEEGCVSFDFHKDTKDENRFVTTEVFKSQAALDTHDSSNHILTFKKAIDGKIENTDVIFMKQIFD